MAWYAHDIDAYDADTMHLTAAEDGIYSRLLRFYYKTRVPLPDDDRALAAIARISHEEWEAVKQTIRAFFKPRRGRLHHKRCDRELDREDSLARIRSEKAKNAAEKRHGKTKASVLRANTEQVPSKDTVMLGDATRPDQTRPEKKESPPKAPRKRGTTDTPEFLSFWEAFPNKVGKGAARRAFATAIGKTDLPALLEAIDRYRSSKPPDREWCHPSTFLNQERWLDQPARANGHSIDVSERKGPTGPPPPPPEGWLEPGEGVH